MSSYGTPVYRSNYQYNQGVVTAWISNYPNNAGVMTVHSTSYEYNPGVMKIYLTDYEHNQGVQKIYMAGCFPENELVHTRSDTYAPIGSLKVGDKISSWDAEQKKTKCNAVKGVHKYIVNDIFCINNSIRVSSTHPVMVMESINGILIPKWKVAFDVKVGDLLVGVGGRLITVKTKSRHWYDTGIEVLNLSTDSGDPFFVRGFVVRAENTIDNINWADTPITQKMIA